MAEYIFEKEINSNRLVKEIRDSNITIALDYITTAGTSCSIFFKADLNSDEYYTLNNIVSSHINTALPEDEMSLLLATLRDINSKLGL